MIRFSQRRWEGAYTRVVRSSFNTVPFYRERWALADRDPVAAVEVEKRPDDLAPIGGGSLAVDPHRGLGHLLRQGGLLGAGTLVGVLGDVPPPARIPGVRRARLVALTSTDCLPEPIDRRLIRLDSLERLASEGRRVAIVAAADDLPELDGAVGIPSYAVRRRLPADPEPGALLSDRLLGHLAVLLRCGRWHLDWRRVYARNSVTGAAFTLLRQGSPRMVDVIPVPGSPLQINTCPKHASPVVST